MTDAISDDFKTTNIAAKTGQNVILSCQIEDNTDMWKWVKGMCEGRVKEDVFLFRDGHVHPQGQHQTYRNRVFPLTSATLGNVILKNVMTNDTGTYECCDFVNGSWKLINSTNLSVVDPPLTVVPPGQTGGSVGLTVGLTVGLSVSAVLLLLVAVVGCIYRRRQPTEDQL
ncbi:unnamed protein product [Oreochromis niloticus]|nr:unnamed protein product [Mustela putorius furo]